MSTWLVGHTPWLLAVRARIPLDILPSRLWLQARSYFNVALQPPSPASPFLSIPTVSYPTTHPDISVFEDMSEQYTSASMPDAQVFTPPTSSETLASLVSMRNFEAAETLRQEMVSHNIPITNDFVYFRAALNVIIRKRRGAENTTQICAQSFEDWLSLLPDSHVRRDSYLGIRDRIFRSAGHINLELAYRLGLVLASKGYDFGHGANQVVAYLARYARPLVLQRYLRELEGRSRDYYSRTGLPLPANYLSSVYSVGVRMSAKAGKAEAALQLVSMAQLHGIHISEVTLSVVVKYAPNTPYAIEQIRIVYPSWSTPLETSSDKNVHNSVSRKRSADITTLAADLRSLRDTLRSVASPSPYAILDFITSYQALRGTHPTRALTILRARAHRHSLRLIATWALTEMLYHRQRKEHIHVLLVFFRHFHPVGIPIHTTQLLVSGQLGRQARKEKEKRLLVSSYMMREKLWPSVHHTAVVWEAIMFFSSRTERDRLYALLLKLVKSSKQQEFGTQESQGPVTLQLPPDTFGDAHFSPFIIPLAKHSPWKASGVLRDMVALGIEPTMVQWSIVARGYAQHGEPAAALRILDQMEEIDRKTNDGADTDDGEESLQQAVPRHLPDRLLGAHTNVLRGFVLAGRLDHAREVEKRLVERLGYQAGHREATDAAINLLRDREEAP